MGRRKLDVEKKSLRRELELFVSAWNTPLKDVLVCMPTVLLLRNAHPTYRPDLAAQCLREGLLSKEEAKEFTAIR